MDIFVDHAKERVPSGLYQGCIGEKAKLIITVGPAKERGATEQDIAK